MASIDIIGILDDGTNASAALPANTGQTINITQYEDLTINLTVFYPSGVPVPLADLDLPLVFTVNKNSAVGTPAFISRAGVLQPLAGPNKATFSLISADTAPTNPGYQGTGRYVCDIWLGNNQIWGLSQFSLNPSAFTPGQPITPPVPAPLIVYGLPSLAGVPQGYVLTVDPPGALAWDSPTEFDHAITALTGDVTATGPGSVPATLSSTGITADTYGDASHVSQVTFDVKGRATSASNVSIQIAESQVTNLVSDLAGKLSTTLSSADIFVGNGSNVAAAVAMSGDATLDNAGALTLASVVSAGSAGDSSHVSQITYDAKGRITAASSVAIDSSPGDFTVNGKLTVTGAIDPTSLSLSGASKFISATDAGPLLFYPHADQADALSFRKADGITAVLSVDTSSGFVGVNNASPTQALDVVGSFAASISATIPTIQGSTASAGILALQATSDATDGVVNLYTSPGKLVVTVTQAADGYAGDSGILFTPNVGYGITLALQPSSSGNPGEYFYIESGNGADADASNDGQTAGGIDLLGGTGGAGCAACNAGSPRPPGGGGSIVLVGGNAGVDGGSGLPAPGGLVAIYGGGGVNGGVNGGIYVGNAALVELGYGSSPVQVDDTLNVLGTSTFTGDVQIDGHVMGSLFFLKEANHTIGIDSSTSPNVDGGSLFVESGMPTAGNANGGSLYLDSTYGVGTGVRGNINVGYGNGSTASAANLNMYAHDIAQTIVNNVTVFYSDTSAGTLIDAPTTKTVSLVQTAGANFSIFNGAGSGQSAAIPDASGGGVVDAEARTAINTLLAYMRTIGFVHT